MCKGGNPNTLKLKIKQICGIILRVWRSAMHTKQFCLDVTRTSFAGNFTMEKALFKNIFYHKTLFVNRFLKIFVALLRLLESRMVT